LYTTLYNFTILSQYFSQYYTRLLKFYSVLHHTYKNRTRLYTIVQTFTSFLINLTTVYKAWQTLFKTFTTKFIRTLQFRTNFYTTFAKKKLYTTSESVCKIVHTFLNNYAQLYNTLHKHTQLCNTFYNKRIYKQPTHLYKTKTLHETLHNSCKKKCNTLHTSIKSYTTLQSSLQQIQSLSKVFKNFHKQINI